MPDLSYLDLFMIETSDRSTYVILCCIIRRDIVAVASYTWRLAANGRGLLPMLLDGTMPELAHAKEFQRLFMACRTRRRIMK